MHRHARNLLKSRFLGLACAAMLLPLAACGSDDAGGGGGGGGGGSASGPSPFGTFTVKVSGKQIDVEYDGGTAEVAMIHRINDKGGPGCVSRLNMKLSKADESCLLDLTFQPSPSGGLSLVEGEFHAVNSASLIRCGEWRGAKPGKGLVYKLKSGKDVFVAAKPVASPESAKTDATVKGVTFKPIGSAGFSASGKQISIKFGDFGIKGDVKSKGSKTAPCGALTGSAQCPDPADVTMGNQVGNHVKRPGYLYNCADGEPYKLDEHCGSDVIWLTMYRRWTEVACGGCADDETCVRKVISEISYQAHCYKMSDNCGGCKDAKKTTCAVGEDSKDTCFEPVKDGDDMTLNAVLADYTQIHEKFSSNNVAAIFVVAEGMERARGKCEKKADGTRSCDDNGPAATQKDCEAVKAKFKLADDVVLLFDKNKKYWASNEWLGPEFYSNGMLVMSGETEIVGLFPTPGASGATSTSQVEASIQKVIDDF